MQLKTADHKYTNVMEPICSQEDIKNPPNDRQLVRLTSQMYDGTTVAGIIQPSNALTEDWDIAFLTTGQVEIHMNNFTDHSYTLKRGSHVANLSVMTPRQMKYSTR